MSDDLKNRGEQDRLRINVHEEHEVRYWTKELSVTGEELERAVKDVGVMAADVRKHLGKVSKSLRGRRAPFYTGFGVQWSGKLS